MQTYSVHMPEFDYHSATHDPIIRTVRTHQRAFKDIPQHEIGSDYLSKREKEIVKPWKSIARDGLRIVDGDAEIPVLHIPAQRDSEFDRTPRVLLNAGTHGDEHAPIHALPELIKSDKLPKEFGYDVIFCANPNGYLRNIRQNAHGIDINRSFFNNERITPEATAISSFTDGHKYTLAVDAHEDHRCNGSYVYEDVRNIAEGGPISPEIAQNWSKHKLPLFDVNENFDLGPVKGTTHLAHRYAPGIVFAEPAPEMLSFARPDERLGKMLTAELQHAGKANATLRIETGQRQSFHRRVEAQQIAILTALKSLLNASRETAGAHSMRSYFGETKFSGENLQGVRELIT